jgi:osmoprotectant transport system substrate-binding protein
MERPDGYRGLVLTYGLRFADKPRIMDLGLLARALQDHQIDFAGGNATDGLIQAFDLVVLEDDRQYFPPYEAVPVVREQVIQQHPEVAQVLANLEGKISDAEMRQMNYAVDSQHRDPRDVVREFLQGRQEQKR